MPKKTKQKLIVGNWKMNPKSMKEAKKLFSDFKKQKAVNKNVTTVFCPPNIYFTEIKKMYKGNKISFGLQDTFFAKEGSYTGEISNSQAKDLGAHFVILGHSERRAHGETSDLIARKVFSALTAGLHVILCVGEKERDAQGAYLKNLSEEIKESLFGVPKNLLKKLIIAYEPIWAIGSGKKAMNAQDMHFMSLFIRKQMIKMYDGKIAKQIPILYGGSVNSDNAVDFVTVGEADGLLIGRASLNPFEFSKIITNVSKAIN